MQLRLSHCPVSGPGFKWPVQPAETCWDNKNEHPATSCIASAPALYGRGRVPVSGFRCRVQRGITEFYKAAFFRQPSLMALCFTMWVQGSVLAWNRLSITPEMRNPVNYSGAQKIEHALSSTGMPWHPPVSSGDGNQDFWMEKMLNLFDLFATAAIQTNWSLKPLGTRVPKDGSSQNLPSAMDHAQRACARAMPKGCASCRCMWIEFMCHHASRETCASIGRPNRF